MNRPWLWLPIVAALAGCSTNSVGFYDECSTYLNCPRGTTICEYVAVEWPYAIVSTYICTAGCFSDFDCPFSHNGEPGYCAKIGDAGNPDQACLERCFDDRDCAGGFACLGSNELPTLAFGTRICVPY